MEIKQLEREVVADTLNSLTYSFCLNIRNITYIKFKYFKASVIDGTIVFLFEPFHSFLFADSVLSADCAFASSSQANSASWSLEDNVEVHTEDTSEGVILNTQINVLLNTESEAAGIGEVSLLEFSVLDLETSF